MRLHALIAAALAIALAGCGPTVSTAIETPPPVAAADTTLGVGDTFDVRVYGEADLSGSYKVEGEGTINFPLIGTIKVVGLDAQQLAKALSEKLANGYLRNPQVSVLVKDQPSKKVTITGQVAKPGIYNFSPPMSIVDGITQAGGFSPLAAKNDTTVTRIENGQKTTTKVAVEDIGRGRAKNFYLRPGDIIDVPERLF